MNNANQNQGQGQKQNQGRNNANRKQGQKQNRNQGRNNRNKNGRDNDAKNHKPNTATNGVNKPALPRCNNCNRTNHVTRDCRHPPRNQTNTVRNNTTGGTLCKYCSLNNHASVDCKNEKLKTAWKEVERRRAETAGVSYCTICERRGHTKETCLTGTGNQTNNQGTGNQTNNQGTGNQSDDPLKSWCQYCNTREHISSRCVYEARKAEYYKSETKCSTCGWKGHTRTCNNPLPAATCAFCGFSGHIGQQCTAERADPEKIWCKFCNQTSHSTASCMQKDPQRRFHTAIPTAHNTCTKCAYVNHHAEACTNPLPDSRCERCTHGGHSRSSCPLQESKKRMFESYRTQVHKELNDCNQTSPGYTLKTQTLAVPSQLVNNMSPYMAGIHGSQIGDRNLRPTLDLMMNRANNQGYGYYHMPWALHCLSDGFQITCGYEGCTYDCRIVDTELQVIMDLSKYDHTKSEDFVFLETTCSHPAWARHMKWTRERAYQQIIMEAAQTLVKFSPNGGQELDRRYFESAEMTEDMRRLKDIAIMKTQRQRESLNKTAPGTIPPVVDEVDAVFDHELGEDNVARGLDAMDLDVD